MDIIDRIVEKGDKSTIYRIFNKISKFFSVDLNTIQRYFRTYVKEFSTDDPYEIRTKLVIKLKELNRTRDKLIELLRYIDDIDSYARGKGSIISTRAKAQELVKNRVNPEVIKRIAKKHNISYKQAVDEIVDRLVYDKEYRVKFHETLAENLEKLDSMRGKLAKAIKDIDDIIQQKKNYTKMKSAIIAAAAIATILTVVSIYAIYNAINSLFENNKKS